MFRGTLTPQCLVTVTVAAISLGELEPCRSAVPSAELATASSLDVTVRATGAASSRPGNSAMASRMMSRSFMLGAHRAAWVSSCTARRRRSWASTSQGLAGPHIGALLLLSPEPKRCERGRCQCSVGRGECRSGGQTTSVSTS